MICILRWLSLIHLYFFLDLILVMSSWCPNEETGSTIVITVTLNMWHRDVFHKTNRLYHSYVFSFLFFFLIAHRGWREKRSLATWFARPLEKRYELPLAFWFSLIRSANGTSPSGRGIVRNRDWFIVNGNWVWLSLLARTERGKKEKWARRTFDRPKSLPRRFRTGFSLRIKWKRSLDNGAYRPRRSASFRATNWSVALFRRRFICLDSAPSIYSFTRNDTKSETTSLTI